MTWVSVRRQRVFRIHRGQCLRGLACAKLLLSFEGRFIMNTVLPWKQRLTLVHFSDQRHTPFMDTLGGVSLSSDKNGSR